MIQIRQGRRCFPQPLTKEGKMETTVRHNVWGLVVAPFTGLAYVIALPFLAIATVAGITIKRAGGGVLKALTTVASFGWRPVESYLVGKRAKKGRRV
jgi:hypothetical protein